MRVLINRYALLGRKTGVGHYTRELLRCLHDLAPGQIAVTPPGGLFQAEQVWHRIRRTGGPRARRAEVIAGRVTALSSTHALSY